MRTHLWLAFLWIAATAPVAAGAEPLRLCGDDYWFSVEPPRGWELSDRTGQMGVALTFHPPGSEDPAIVVALPLGSTSLRPRAVDLDRALQGMIGMMSLSAAPSAIRDWQMQHPRRPTRSVILEQGSRRIHLSIVDAGSGRGDVFTVLLRHEGHASDATLRRFREVLSSLRFDPTRVCKMGSAGEVVEQRIEPVTASAAAAPAAQGRFPLGEAVSGCVQLQELFVPVLCKDASLGGRLVEVVTFSDGREPASALLERHRDRVTAPWCWAARSRSDAPGLLFGIRGDETYREYSCETGKLTGAISLDELLW